MRRLNLLYLAFFVVAVPAAAQDLNDEQQALLALFQQQRDAVAAAQSGDPAATRGPVLIPVEDLVTDPVLVEKTPTSTEPDFEDPSTPGEELSASGDGETATANSDELPRPSVVHVVMPPGITVDEQINFPFDSAALTTDQVPRLEQLCTVMRASDIKLFRIVGHTDTAGSDDYNERLSLLRAQEVRRYFVNTCGMAPEQLEAVGMGERFLADPDDPQGADNRRVEFQALS